MFRIYRILVRYGNEWAPAQPNAGSNDIAHYVVEFQENEYLTHIYASVGDVGVFHDVILDIELHTNMNIYGNLHSTQQYYNIDILSEKAFFTGYIRTLDEIHFVSGLKLVSPTRSGNVCVYNSG